MNTAENLKEVKGMPNIKSAIKRVKTNNEKRAHNSTIKSAMRSAVKAFEVKVANNDVEGAKVAYVEAVRKLDKAAGRNIIHKNTVARNKSRLAKQLNGLTA
jgi:small subunit ribosomal protein S20